MNDPPAATGDNYAVDSLGTLAVVAPGLLANDIDPDGDPLSAVLVSGPSHGQLTLAADGSMQYTPDEGYVGDDSFTYRVTDSLEQSGVATVSIEVLPLDPASEGGSGDDGGGEDEGTGDDGSGDNGPDDSQPDGANSPSLPPEGSQPSGLGHPPSQDPTDTTKTLTSADSDQDPAGENDESEDASAWIRKAGTIGANRRDVRQTPSPTTEEHGERGTPDTATEMDAIQREYGTLWKHLDAFQKDVTEAAEASEAFDSIVVGTSAVGVTGLTIGYVVWMLRAGTLLASVITSVPAWMSFDPLPVLDSFDEDRDDDEDDDGCLVSMVTRGNEKPSPEEE